MQKIAYKPRTKFKYEIEVNERYRNNIQAPESFISDQEITSKEDILRLFEEHGIKIRNFIATSHPYGYGRSWIIRAKGSEFHILTIRYELVQ